MRGRPAFFDRKLGSEDEAREFVLERHNKWEAAVAVSFYLPAKEGVRDKARVEKARTKAREAQAARSAGHKKAWEAFTGAKSGFVGCKGCKSKLSRSHIKQTHLGVVCPLCSSPLLSATVTARLAALKGKAEKAEKAVREARAPKPSKKLGWAIGGWAAC